MQHSSYANAVLLKIVTQHCALFFCFDSPSNPYPVLDPGYTVDIMHC
jgi:hypothetical protein